MSKEHLYKKVLEIIPDWAKENVVLAGLRGSDAHGTKLEPSDSNSIDDTDVFIVIKHDPDFYMSLRHMAKTEHVWEKAGKNVDIDILIYDITKFIQLLGNCNPNVVNWLWNRPEDYFYISKEGQYLIDNRKVFLDQSIFKRLYGYAKSQLDQALDEHKKHQGYMGEVRKKLVEQYGYDVKNMAHCYRLVMMSQELLTTGQINTFRPVNEQEIIKSIKRGEYPLNRIKDLVESEINKSLKLEKDYKHLFSKRTDYDLINQILINVIKGI